MAILKQKCQEIEQQHPAIDGILFTNSRAKAFIQHTKYFQPDYPNITSIGFDLTDDNIELLCSDQLDYLLNERPFQQGRLSVVNIIDYLYYYKQVPLKKYLPIDIVIKENYASYLPPKVNKGTNGQAS